MHCTYEAGMYIYICNLFCWKDWRFSVNFFGFQLLWGISNRNVDLEVNPGGNKNGDNSADNQLK